MSSHSFVVPFVLQKTFKLDYFFFFFQQSKVFTKLCIRQNVALCFYSFLVSKTFFFLILTSTFFYTYLQLHSKISQCLYEFSARFELVSNNLCWWQKTQESLQFKEKKSVINFFEVEIIKLYN